MQENICQLDIYRKCEVMCVKIDNINLTDGQEEKLRVLMKWYGTNLSTFLTVFLEDLLNDHDLLKKWAYGTFKRRQDEMITKTLKDMYHNWSLMQDKIDEICEKAECQLPESIWKEIEESIINDLSKLQESSFWEGARALSKLKGILDTFPTNIELLENDKQ